jgi:U3 small nucleolar RNA-associated protein 3
MQQANANSNISMAKKRKVSGRNGTSESINGFEPKGGKMGAITTYEDVANSEDEFHINRDKVMLDDGPEAKRRRKWQEEGRLYPQALKM